jgi:hypothetical protein
VRGIDFNAVFELEQALKDAVIEGIGSLFSCYGEIRASYITDEERIAGQET